MSCENLKRRGSLESPQTLAKVPKIKDDDQVINVKEKLDDSVENFKVISTEYNDGTDDTMISIPKRKQINAEVSRTQKFSEECIELFKNWPERKLNFYEFMLAYSNHFGRQCRLADYGFKKLFKLFKAIPTTIEVTKDVEGKRILQLTDSAKLNVVRVRKFVIEEWLAVF